MASDSQDSHRKHRRSNSNDESPEISKRHKHRHHRHHHRRHRHQRSKHDEEKKDEIDVEMKAEEKSVDKHGDYDMEEGEIVEEDGIDVVEAAINDIKVASDVESGELNDSFMKEDGTVENAPRDYDRRSSKNSKSMRSDQDYTSEESPVSVSIANGDAKKKSSRSESRHGRNKSPLRGSSKHRDKHRSQSKEPSVDLIERDEVERDSRRNSHSKKTKDVSRKGTHRSPSHGRHRLETGDRSFLESPDRMRDGEHSESIVHERHSRRHHRERDERTFENDKVDKGLDVERVSRGRTEYMIDVDERANDKPRDRSSSRHRSSKHENGDLQDREREEMMYRDKHRLREQEPYRGRSNRDWGNERNRWGRDSEMESYRDSEKARETKRDMDWNGERDREYKREKSRGRSRDRDHEGERRRDVSISSYRDRDQERERDRDRDRVRKSDGDCERDKYRGRVRPDDDFDRNRRYHRSDDHGNGHGVRDRRHGYDEEYRRDRDRKYESEKDRPPIVDSSKQTEVEVKRDDDDQEEYQERVELKLAQQEEDDVDRIKEESRRRREAILQKYKSKQSQQQEIHSNAKESGDELKEQPSQNFAPANVVQPENSDGSYGSGDASKVNGSFNIKKSPLGGEVTAVETSTGGGLGEGSPKSERSNDMFCDDIFGESPAGISKKGRGDDLPIECSGLHDNWDDPEGYYSFRFGEILDSRYEITAAHGKGVFSTVVRAKDLKAGSDDPEEVAIKIIRNNETMFKAGTEELVILKKLVGADPDDRRHCVRYLSNFKYRNHLCIVFESLHMNLREVLKKFGRNIGLKLTAVRAYSKQLFIALKHLKNCGVLHSDIKPDNMLVNDAKNVLKLCDFGNAMFAGKNEITPYLVSRFYRAPEIILGLPYDHPMDVWSVGCCLYELYTGKVLFPGATNNDMLRLHMELKGPFPKKMLRKGAFIEQHFDQDLNFLAIEEDPVTKKAIRRVIFNMRPKDIGTIIKGSPGEDPKMLTSFKDLLDKIFVLDPDKRLTVSQALNHPFITGK